MGIKHVWMQGKSFARTIPRQIDRETILDMLRMVEYESKRQEQLDEIGITDNGSSSDCLFDYVLDALGVPCENGSFKRDQFEALFYSNYLLENEYIDVEAALAAMTELRDTVLARLQTADKAKQGFRIVKADCND